MHKIVGGEGNGPVNFIKKILWTMRPTSRRQMECVDGEFEASQKTSIARSWIPSQTHVDLEGNY